MKKTCSILLVFSFCIPGISQILRNKIPDKLVVFTFDDATSSQYSIVAPLLKQYGFGATFYVCEFPPNFKDSSKYLNWRQIKQLDRMGFEVANHTRTHPLLSHLTPDQISEQIRFIEKKCDSLKIQRPVTFAYPAYDFNPAVLTILKDRAYWFARAGGSRAYDPLTDYPLLIPSWAMTDNNEEQIRLAIAEARDGKIVILTIHGVPDEEHPWVTTTPELFRKYLQFLSDNDYKVIAMRDLNQYINIDEAMKNTRPDFNKKLKN